MRRMKKLLKFVLPYGMVRAYQVGRERDWLRAQLEAERAAAREHATISDARTQEQREIVAAQEQLVQEQRDREEASRREEERKLFHENEIVYDGKRVFTFSSVPNTTLNIGGTGNVISLNKFSGNGHLHFIIQSSAHDCKVSIGKNNTLNGNLVIQFYYGGGRSPNKSTIEMGDHNIVNGNLCLIGGMQPGTVVSIGNENLFADNINLIGAVDHLIYNVKTNEKYCDELGVSIKDRVWVCRDALFLNGACVGPDSIVAARSVVNKEFKESNVLIAGIPAQVRKTDVMWHLNTTEDYLSSSSPLMI
jgi:acetyltransferase-like isoleucine patch superfamily enzyme